MVQFSTKVNNIYCIDWTSIFNIFSPFSKRAREGQILSGNHIKLKKIPISIQLLWTRIV